MARLAVTNTHGLTPTDLKRLEKKQTDVHLRVRIMAVRLVMEGRMGKETAQLCNLHRQSVSTYVKKFNEGGIDALLDRKYGPGRACFLTEDQQDELKKMMLTSSPSDHGLGCGVSWTTPIIREYLKNTYHIQMSLTGILRMLWRLGLSYTRPTYVLAKADPEKQRVFRQEMNLIKKTSPRRYRTSLPR
ncbi:helix-turn-helix domain-containing protein [Priestia abyssalis]|uniref:helix-turn-helix domain-containing protein n=1 Tax=Priestia abyssalis TaxID=1221450 RepID=UPI0009959DB2|nr:winged helix-turn-helix domain-containing protein [Priestia abyssalis]